MSSNPALAALAWVCVRFVLKLALKEEKDVKEANPSLRKHTPVVMLDIMEISSDQKEFVVFC